MYRRHLAIGFVCGWFGLFGGAPAAAAPSGDTATDALPVRIVDHTASASVVEVSTGGAAFTRTLKIEAIGDAAVDGLRLTTAVETDPSDGGASILLDGGAELALPSLARNAARLVQVSGVLPLPGMYHFTLHLVGAGAAPRSFGLKVTRSAPALELDGAKGATLGLETERSAYTTRLVLRTTSAVAAEDVAVEVLTAKGPDGEAAVVRVAGSDARAALGTIEAGGTRAFEFAAQLPESGKYLVALEVTYLGGHKSYEISLEKKLKAASLDASVAAAGAAMIAPPLLGVAKPSLHLALNETGGTRLALNQPALVGLTRTQGTAAPVAAGYREVAFFAADGKPIENWPVTLAPNASQDLRIDVGGIDEPGRFAGKLRLPAQDRGAVEVAVAFEVQRHWLVAFLVIAAGVFVSLLIRLWVTRLQPRMRELQSVLQVLGRLDRQRSVLGGLRAEEREVFDRLRERLGWIYESLRIGSADAAGPILSGMEKKLDLLPRWIALDRQLAGLESMHSARDRVKELDGVRDYLLDPSPADGGHAAAAETLKGLPDKIRATVSAALAEFRASIEDLGLQLGDGVLTDVWQRRVAAPVQAAETSLAGDAYVEAAEQIDQARLGAAGLLADALGSRLPEDGSPPAWMTEHRFAYVGKCLAEVKAAVFGTAAVDAYRRALAHYLEPYAADLVKRVDGLSAGLNDYLKSGPADAAAVHEGLATLGEAKLKLDAVATLLREGKLGEAAGACREADAAYAECLGKAPAALQVPQAGRRQKKPAADEKAAGGEVPELVLPLPAPEFPRFPAQSEGAMHRVIATTTRLDVLYHLLVGLVTALLGVYVLWVGNSTWGSAGDLLLAALWGLGLHALTTKPDSYKGFVDLAGKLGK